jgi:hypothetical protein
MSALEEWPNAFSNTLAAWWLRADDEQGKQL